MDAKTLKALKASIKHWEENVEAQTLADASVEPKDCALCGKFLKEDCNGCPVKIAGFNGCEGSPYDDACFSFLKGDFENFHDDAKEELSFLKSLLPEPAKDGWTTIGEAASAALALAKKATKK